MKDRTKPPKGRICHSFGGLAWIEPNGVIHWIADGLSHPTWAYMHLNSLSGPTSLDPDTAIDHHEPMRAAPHEKHMTPIRGNNRAHPIQSIRETLREHRGSVILTPHQPQHRISYARM
jgi:hypothetical protein